MVQTLDSASVLFAKNPLPMWVYDPSTLAILDVNEAAVRAYGWSRTEFLGMSILGLRPDDEEVRDEQHRIPYKIVKAANGDAHVQFEVNGQT